MPIKNTDGSVSDGTIYARATDVRKLLRRLPLPEPKAWMVWCPKGNEFDYKVYADQDGAAMDGHCFAEDEIDAMDHDPTEEEQNAIYAHYEPIPLYTEEDLCGELQ